MLNCILEINISIINLQLLCLHFMTSLPLPARLPAFRLETHVTAQKQYLDDTIQHGHQFNSLYVYGQQPVRA